MKTATFYLMEEEFSQTNLESHEWLACHLAAINWRMGKRILITCENQIQAKKLDETLWEKKPNQFIPHNLTGEGPNCGAPIEISWTTKRNTMLRDILINLELIFADFITSFHEVIDFVPINEDLKKLARKRYKMYQTMGFNLIIASPKTTL